MRTTIEGQSIFEPFVFPIDGVTAAKSSEYHSFFFCKMCFCFLFLRVQQSVGHGFLALGFHYLVYPTIVFFVCYSVYSKSVFGLMSLLKSVFGVVKSTRNQLLALLSLLKISLLYCSQFIQNQLF